MNVDAAEKNWRRTRESQGIKASNRWSLEDAGLGAWISFSLWQIQASKKTDEAFKWQISKSLSHMHLHIRVLRVFGFSMEEGRGGQPHLKVHLAARMATSRILSSQHSAFLWLSLFRRNLSRPFLAKCRCENGSKQRKASSAKEKSLSYISARDARSAPPPPHPVTSANHLRVAFSLDVKISNRIQA